MPNRKVHITATTLTSLPTEDKDVTTSVYIQPDIASLRRHLFSAVQLLDNNLPLFSTDQGCSRYAEGSLCFSLYGGDPPTPNILDNPQEEDPAYIAHNDASFWQ